MGVTTLAPFSVEGTNVTDQTGGEYRRRGVGKNHHTQAIVPNLGRVVVFGPETLSLSMSERRLWREESQRIQQAPYARKILDIQFENVDWHSRLALNLTLKPYMAVARF
jgi:hypothetical protein